MTMVLLGPEVPAMAEGGSEQQMKIKRLILMAHMMAGVQKTARGCNGGNGGDDDGDVAKGPIDPSSMLPFLCGGHLGYAHHWQCWRVHSMEEVHVSARNIRSL